MFDTQQKSHEKKSLDVETIHYRHLGEIRLINTQLFISGRTKTNKEKAKAENENVMSTGKGRTSKARYKKGHQQKWWRTTKELKAFETMYNVGPQAEYNSDSQHNKLQRT